MFAVSRAVCARNSGQFAAELGFEPSSEPAGRGLPQFDRLLLDVPCSGLGVLSKGADLRWRRSPKDLEAVVKAQVSNGG